MQAELWSKLHPDATPAADGDSSDAGPGPATDSQENAQVILCPALFLQSVHVTDLDVFPASGLSAIALGAALPRLFTRVWRHVRPSC